MNLIKIGPYCILHLSLPNYHEKQLKNQITWTKNVRVTNTWISSQTWFICSVLCLIYSYKRLTYSLSQTKKKLTLTRLSVDVFFYACAVYVFFTLNCHMPVHDGCQANKSVRSLQLNAETDYCLYSDGQVFLWLGFADISIIDSTPGPVHVTLDFPDCLNELSWFTWEGSFTPAFPLPLCKHSYT